MIIEGGTGNGYKTGVNEENMLLVRSVISNLEFHANSHEQEAYSVQFAYTPTGAGDCFGYIKNNSDDDMVVSAIIMYCASDETFSIKLGDEGTAAGGATVTPVNRNAGSGNLADVTAEGAVDITGLSGGSVVAGLFVKGGETSTKIEIKSGLIIPKNKMISFYVATGTAAVKFGAEIYFHHE
jgi:hypothetical protein